MSDYQIRFNVLSAKNGSVTGYMNASFIDANDGEIKGDTDHNHGGLGIAFQGVGDVTESAF